MQTRELCPVAQLPLAGHLQELTVDGRLLCVLNEDGQLFALDGACPHRGAPLAEGTLENGKLICPWHAWAFDLRTGEEQSGCDSIGTYRVDVVGDRALVVLP